MKSKQIFICLIVWVPVIFSTGASASIPGFLDEMFIEFETEYAGSQAGQYEEFCGAYGLDPASAENRQTFLKIHFLHDLLTTDGVSNCARGGFLRIPYFWHYTSPNPRHSMFYLPDSIPLATVKPPGPYGRYKSHADIDRVPALFLGDMVSERPAYYHPDCGTFYSFGWCSEREMSFTSVMFAWGYRSKIWQSGIHTFTVVLCVFTGTDGGRQYIEAKVDNTFDTIRWKRLDDSVDITDWLGRIGEGTDIGWYNDKARSAGQIEAIESSEVGPVARARIRALIEAGLAD